MPRIPSHNVHRFAPPRVLVVMPEQWPRALLRAALREAGYDAVGAQTLESGLRVRPVDEDRGPVRLVLIDQAAMSRGALRPVAELLARHHDPPALLLARTTVAVPPGPWTHVLRRPVSVADIVATVESLIPLGPGDRQALD